jgi:hypothetical protein
MASMHLDCPSAGRGSTMPTALKKLIAVLLLLAGSWAWADVPEYQWVLVDVRYDHNYQGSAELPEALIEVESVDIAASGGAGSITVRSGGYLDDGEPCEERYRFNWEVSPVESIPTTGVLLDASISIDASGTATSVPSGQCPGSNDAAMTGGGSLGVQRPMFMTASEWDAGLPTEQGSERIYGFSDFYPNDDQFQIEVPALDPGDFKQHMAFHFVIGIGNPAAGGILEYSIVYLYALTEKNRAPLEYRFSTPAEISLDAGSRTQLCVSNATPFTQSVIVSLYGYQPSGNDFADQTCTELAAGEERCFELELPPDELVTGDIELWGAATGYPGDGENPCENLTLQTWNGYSEQRKATVRSRMDAMMWMLNLLLEAD